MPGGSGLDFCRDLKADPPTDGIAFLQGVGLQIVRSQVHAFQDAELRLKAVNAELRAA